MEHSPILDGAECVHVGHAINIHMTFDMIILVLHHARQIAAELLRHFGADSIGVLERNSFVTQHFANIPRNTETGFPTALGRA